MGLDSNIILQGRAPQLLGPMDIAKDAMNLKQLAMQQQQFEAQNKEYQRKLSEENSMTNLLKNNIQQDDKGNYSLNRGAALSELYKVNPLKALEFQKTLASQDLDQLKAHTETAKNLAWSVTPENWAQTKQKAISVGLPNAEQLPDQYTPEFVNRWQLATLNGEEQVKKMQFEKENQLKEKQFSADQGWKSKEYDLNTKKLDIEKQKANSEMNKKSGLREGQKALDRDYAKDFNDWTSTSRNSLEKNLQRLENAKSALSEDTSLSGPLRGLLPDNVRNFTNEKAISVRDEVRAAAQGALKATLGSAFTEKEGERIMNQAYNEKLSPEENIRKIDQAINELKSNKLNNDKKAYYFQKNGTLSGLEALPSESIAKKNISKEVNQKQIFKTDQIEWAD